VGTRQRDPASIPHNVPTGDSLTVRPCPTCSQTLISGRYGPLDLDLCRTCAGAWFDVGELSRLIAAGPQIVRRLGERLQPDVQPGTAPPAPRPPECPSCRTALDPVEYASMGGIRLDCCKNCEGFWVTCYGLIRLSWALAANPRGQDAGLPPELRPPPPALQPAVSTQPAQPVQPAQPGRSQTESCLECGEVNSITAASCWACGKPLRGPVVGKCPQCEAAMRQVSAGGVTANACEGCGGVWLTPGRLNALLLQPRDVHQRLIGHVSRFHPSRQGRLHIELVCPTCSLFMLRGPLGMLTKQPVHSCPQCFGLFMSLATFEDVLPGGKPA
jgi:Zn-finger nucleic acid-binding protein